MWNSNIESIQFTISDLLDNVELLNEKSLNAQELSVDYNWKKIIKDWTP